CREAEYRALATALALTQAIVVQPLTAEQVETYLEQGGAALKAVRMALATDPDLRALLDTPLMLNVLALAYEGVPVGADIPPTRQQMFAAYVQRMLTRHPSVAPYTPQQTQQWLAYLARQLRVHSQSVFYIEQLQPNWLSLATRSAYKLLVAL